MLCADIIDNSLFVVIVYIVLNEISHLKEVKYIRFKDKVCVFISVLVLSLLSIFILVLRCKRVNPYQLKAHAID